MNRRLFPVLACLLSLVSLHAAEEPAEPASPPKHVQATAAEELKALAGQTAIVEGKVTRIGATSAGGITFINMGGGANGFVAVVFKSNYGAFPNGFDEYKGKTLQVTGKIELFKETTPQIAVKSPEQIKVVADAPKPEEGGEIKPE
jgi:DNA/RNA endonuclease YhcR with UshA esterase domain